MRKILILTFVLFISSCSWFTEPEPEIDPDNFYFSTYPVIHFTYPDPISSCDLGNSSVGTFCIINLDTLECTWNVNSIPSFISSVSPSSGTLYSNHINPLGAHVWCDERIDIQFDMGLIDFQEYSEYINFSFNGGSKKILIKHSGIPVWDKQLNCFWGVNSSFNNPISMDVDNDADTDIICTYVDSDTTKFAVFENTGTTEYPYFNLNCTFFNGIEFPGQYTDFTFIDMDSDSNYEIVIGGEFYKKNLNNDWEIMANWKQGMTNNSLGNVLVFGDLDNDNLIDIIDISKNETYKNIGTQEFPVWGRKKDDWGSFSNYNDAVLYDFDNDSDMDIFMSNSSHIYCYENTGTVLAPSWKQQNYWVSGISYSDSFSFIDINGDNIDDLVIELNSIIDYYECRWRPNID